MGDRAVTHFSYFFLPEIFTSSYLSSHIFATSEEWLTRMTHLPLPARSRRISIISRRVSLSRLPVGCLYPLSMRAANVVCASEYGTSSSECHGDFVNQKCLIAAELPSSPCLARAIQTSSNSLKVMLGAGNHFSHSVIVCFGFIDER